MPFIPNNLSWSKIVTATLVFTCHSGQKEERRWRRRVWKTEDGHQFLDHSPTEKWGFCPLPLSELLCPLEDGRTGVVLVFNPSHKKMSAFTVSRNILPGSFALPWDTPDHSDCLLEKPCVGTLIDSLCLAQPASHVHQSASPVNKTILAPVGQPTHPDEYH